MAPLEHAIKAALAGKIPQAEIAEAFGRTPGRISQIAATTPAPAASDVEIEIAERTNKLELTALKALEEKLELYSVMAKPLELVRVAAILNSMKRRSGGLLGAGDFGGNITLQDNRIVALELPAAAKPTIVTDSRGQIIESDGRTLVTASRTQITNLGAQNVSASVPAISGPTEPTAP